MGFLDSRKSLEIIFCGLLDSRKEFYNKILWVCTILGKSLAIKFWGVVRLGKSLAMNFCGVVRL